VESDLTGPAAPHPDRRRGKRQPAGCRGITSARIRPGHAALLIDLSAGGALVETGRRLLPGTRVELQLIGPDDRASIGGTVLRCSVSALAPDSVCYRGAIQFDRPLATPQRVDGEYELPISRPRGFALF
jgi:hypothetical protein